MLHQPSSGTNAGRRDPWGHRTREKTTHASRSEHNTTKCEQASKRTHCNLHIKMVHRAQPAHIGPQAERLARVQERDVHGPGDARWLLQERQQAEDFVCAFKAHERVDGMHAHGLSLVFVHEAHKACA